MQRLGHQGRPEQDAPEPVGTALGDLDAPPTQRIRRTGQPGRPGAGGVGHQGTIGPRLGLDVANTYTSAVSRDVRRRLSVLGVCLAAPLAVASAWIPLRDHYSNLDVALLLVLAVMAVGTLGSA